MPDLETPAPHVETPPAAPTAEQTPPAAPPAEPPAEADELPEGAIEQAGQVMVPLAALRAERETVRTLKGKAAQYDQAAQYVNQVRPYVEFLQANPDLMTRRHAPPSQPAPAADPVSDEKFEKLAIKFDLYTAEGKPDAGRAKDILDILRGEARAEAQTVMAPVQAQSLQERAIANYHEAVRSQAPNGAKVDPQVLWNVWSKSDPKVVATPEGAAAAWMLAYGMQAAQVQTQVTPPAAPPVFTENSGSRLVNRAPLSELDQRIIQVRGMDPKKYAEHAKSFKAGETNVIED